MQRYATRYAARYTNRYANRYGNRTFSTMLLRAAGHGLRLILALILTISRINLLMRLRLHLLRTNFNLARRILH